VNGATVSQEAMDKAKTMFPAKAPETTPSNGNGRKLDVDAYLDHYGIPYKKKTNGTGVIYGLLNGCIFDQGHTSNEAAIIQTGDGALLYQCFHDSCKSNPERLWKAARKIISGNDRLITRFMRGGTPEKTHGNTNAGRRTVDGVRPSSTSGDPAFDEYRTDDLGNAQRFLDLHRKDILWAGEWYVFNGKLWQRDQTFEVNKKAEGMQKAILDQLAGETNDRQRRDLLSLALKLGSHSKIKAMLELSKSGVAVKQDTFDTGRYLLNCENGTIDLKTGELLPHRREDYITRMLPVAYDPQAPCPKWTGFLKTIFGGSATLIAFVQRAIGYSLTADTGEQCFFILYGTGQNGKSTFLNVITKMLDAYAVTCRMDTFIAKKGNQIPNDVARLNGSRFVSAIETERGRKLAEGLIKSMTGGDEMAARFLHHEYFEFEPTFKIWLGVNHKPVIKDTTFAMSRRIRLIPFTVTITEADRVLNFHEILIREELPGILAWAVEGCQLWQEEGLGWTKDVKEATDQYLMDMDVLGDFLREKCRIEVGEKVAFKDLHEAYLKWATENKEEPLGRKTFAEVLEEKGFPAVISHGNVRERKGLCLVLSG
jgi:putative DNA primase/helicase